MKIHGNTITLPGLLTLFFLLTTTIAFSSPITNNKDIVALQILTINDFHGALLENGKNPGAAKMAQYLQDQKEKNPTGTLILSGGDMFQGSPDSNLLYGKTVVTIMNQIGFDAMVIGNHEFDWGIPVLQQRIEQSKFPYLAANIIEKATGKPASFAKPYVFYERKGVKIAIIGMSTPETAYATSPKITAPYTFADPIQTVNDLVPKLKQHGADLIIVLSHMGSVMDKTTGKITGEAADLAMNTHGINAIVSAHSHQLVNGTVNDIPIVQASSLGRAVGSITIVFDKTTKQLILSNATTTLLPLAGLTENPPVKAIIANAQGEIAPVKNIVLGSTIHELSHDRTAQQVSALGQLTTDTMRQATNADIAFQNAGGIRTSIPAGNITMGNLYEVFPFDNTLFTMEMTGAQIMKVLEHGIRNDKMGIIQFSGLHVIYDELQTATTPFLVTLLDGSPLDLTKTYTVVTNDFLATGGDNFTMFKESKNLVDTYIPLRDILATTIKKQKIINLIGDDRFLHKKGLSQKFEAALFYEDAGMFVVKVRHGCPT